MVNITNPPKSTVHILLDSEITLHKLSSDYTRFKFVLETNGLLNKLSESLSIEVINVPAHKGIDGNERADMLAKEGVEIVPIGPEPYILT